MLSEYYDRALTIRHCRRAKSKPDRNTQPQNFLRSSIPQIRSSKWLDSALALQGEFPLRIGEQHISVLLDILDQVSHIHRLIISSGFWSWRTGGRWPSTSPRLARNCLRVLTLASGRTGLLPSSYRLKENLVKSDKVPRAGGRFGDVWQGVYNGHRLLSKALKVDQKVDLDLLTKVGIRNQDS